jgi:CheY-like chemotaxis protein
MGTLQPEPMSRLPRPGQRIHWRNPRHAHAIGWLYSYGPGPFEVVGVVDRSRRGLPAGVLLKTDLGEKEVNEVWLTLDEPANGKGLSVLVVDDDHDTAFCCCHLLARWGHRPLAAYDAAAAWAAALAVKPDVVLLDIGLPGMNGWALCRRLRNEPCLEDSVLFAVTGCGMDADREKCYAAGFDHHLLKPVEPERLRRLLAALSALPGPR